jgi:hypothetical protein
MSDVRMLSVAQLIGPNVKITRHQVPKERAP